ncbi:MAG: hypothetical protein CL878_09290 [Dehalococcoidia bacterium]|nr:hypothetical protein [Dehalococcoidia bacterium]
MASGLGAFVPRRASPTSASRRHALAYMAVTAAGCAATVAACSSSGSELQALSSASTLTPDKGATPLSAGDLAPRITPNDELFVQSYRETPPDGDRDPETWTLAIDGLVSERLELTLADVLALPAAEQQFTLECIGNPVGGQLIGNAVWVGTLLRPLLERAEIKPWAKRVAFHSLDDYVTSIPVEQAMAPGVLLAYRMNGEQLPPNHGAPLRLLNPGYYGQKCPKWLKRIEIIERDDHRGTWEQEGWSDQAAITVNSRIDEPFAGEELPETAINVTGVALGGLPGVSSVEVSTDGGLSWQEATLGPTPLPAVWTMWSYHWRIPKPGSYLLVVRATDGDGRSQPDEDVVTLDGQTAPHYVGVNVQPGAGSG